MLKGPYAEKRKEKNKRTVGFSMSVLSGSSSLLPFDFGGRLLPGPGNRGQEWTGTYAACLLLLASCSSDVKRHRTQKESFLAGLCCTCGVSCGAGSVKS